MNFDYILGIILVYGWPGCRHANYVFPVDFKSHQLKYGNIPGDGVGVEAVPSTSYGTATTAACLAVITETTSILQDKGGHPGETVAGPVNPDSGEGHLQGYGTKTVPSFAIRTKLLTSCKKPTSDSAYTAPRCRGIILD
ncbi:hypothetical protein SK128_020078 [Halocaridina rubra]|uniref:Uncharacterized protein n=1 Tax=Halocaridina rubra TaxID=373956 RepID=A0AAN8XI23_HALRR